MAEIPGLNSFNNRLPPAQGGGVPDLIMNAPARQAPQAPASGVAPHQAPVTPQVQQTMQTMVNALIEMNLPPTPQNVQIAQTLASYGQAVNQQTMQSVQSALAQMGDNSTTAIQATVILLTNDKAVTPETLQALKQLLNGKSLPTQLQHLSQELTPLTRQLQSPENRANLEQASRISQQIVQASQGGDAAKTSVVQQVAGQNQAISHQSEGSKRVDRQDTVQKIQQLEQSDQKSGIRQTEASSQESERKLNVTRHSPQESNPRSLDKVEVQLHQRPQSEALLAEQKAIQQLRARGVDPTPQMTKILIRQLQDISQLTRQLTEVQVLKNFENLGIQQKQMTQLLGVLETKVQEFRALFKKMFPDLAYHIQETVHLDGMDMFSKLAHLLEEGNNELRANLKYAAQLAGDAQLLENIRNMLEQVGVHMEKISNHLMAREILVQNNHCFCMPFAVSVKGELFPAEIKIEPDREKPPSANGDMPLKISLTVETKNLGRVNVSMSTLKKDMDVALKVTTRRVQQIVQEKLNLLKTKLESRDYQVHHLQCQVELDLESRHSMLLPTKHPVRTLRRVEGVV